MAVALAAGIALAAIWIGYPVLMALLALLAPRRRHITLTESPAVSVIIATRDGAHAIRARVQDCLAAAYEAGKLEVVVALDAHGETSARHLADLPVTVVRGDEPGKAGALNAGVRAARGSVLVFTDAHQRFEPDAVGALVDAVRAPGVGVAGGTLLIPARAGNTGSLALAYWRYERWLRRSEARVESCVGVSGSIYAMRRELWAELPANLILDDVYVPMRAVLGGWRVAYTARARAVESRCHSSRDEFHRKVRTLTGVLQLCLWLPAVLVPFRNPIWVQFVFHKLLRLLTPYLALVALVAIAASAQAAPYLVPGLALGAVLVAGAALFDRAWLRRVRRMAGEAVLLNCAVLMAGYNALRGRWHVWTK